MKNKMKTHRLKPWLFGSTLTTLAFAFWSVANAAPQEVFKEIYESDGSGTRYTVENPSDDGSNDYFARRQEGSAGTTVRGGAIQGLWYWGARDLDGDGVEVNDLEDHEARITWTDAIPITGIGNLRITVAVAQGNNGQEFDNPMAFQYKIDDGEWVTAGGFRGLHSNSPSYFFAGGNFDVSAGSVPLPTDPRLTRTFRDWDFPILGSGDELRFRVFVNANGGSEEYGHDNIRIIGDDDVSFLTLSMNALEFDEGVGTATLTATLESAAGAGGVTLNVTNSDSDNNSESNVPTTLTVAEGETAGSISFDILADNRFDGNEPVRVQVGAPGWSAEEIIFTVNNVDAKPNVVLNELYTDPFNDDLSTNLQGDSNGDGFRSDDQDEFIEIFNNEDFDVDISFWELWDERGPRHIFPANTILKAGQVAVVFGGGTPRGIFGGSLFMISSQGNFSIAPDGENASIRAGGTNAAGGIVDEFTIPAELGATKRSANRDPDGTGPFVDHGTLSNLPDPSMTEPNIGPTSFWSPGTRPDGSAFFPTDNVLSISFDSGSVAENAGSISGTVSLATAAGAGGVVVSMATEGPNADELVVPATVTIAEGETSVAFTATPVNDEILDGDRELTVRVTGDLKFPALTYLVVTEVEPDLVNVVINEAMASVLGTGTDFNQNGITEEPVEDQFIELLNVGDSAVNLDGWQIHAVRTNEPDPELLVHEFRSTTIIQSQGSVVIFGGGDEAAIREAGADSFGDAAIFVANGSFNGVNLTDRDDNRITLTRGAGFIEDVVEFLEDFSGQGQSVVRSPDGTGAFGETLHLAVSSAFELASPGRQLDGTAFSGNAPFVANLDEFRGDDIPGFPGWKASPWYKNYNAAAHPWIYHDEHGWQYLDSGNTEDVIFIYDLDLADWLFVNESSYRWFYLFSDTPTWIFSFDDNVPGRRFFQRLDDGAIFSRPADL